MSTVTVRLNKEEESLFKEYARLKNLPLSTVLKQALEMMIEEEFDLQAIREYEQGLDTNDNKLLTHDEVKEKLGL